MSEQSQLDRIEAKLDKLVAKVSFLDGRTAGISALTTALIGSMLALAMVVTGCAGGYYATLGPESRADELVVALIREDGVAYCTGFVVERRIVTAAHCIGADAIRVGYQDGMSEDGNSWDTTYAVTVISKDVGYDIAILTQPRWGYGFQIRDRPVVLGEHLTIIGHSRGVHYIHIHGQVSHTSRGQLGHWPTEQFFLSDAVALRGFSGGPVLDSQGMLIGMQSFSMGISGIIPATEIAKRLFENTRMSLDP